ncbi:hypothetical protein D3C76_1742490 [compost metagenome]
MSGNEVLHLLARLEEEAVEIVVDGVRYSAPIERENGLPASLRMNARYQVHYDRDSNGEVLRVRLSS